ncbi:hypothetical protein HZA38_03025 [Candidatus Peregrinibacteria bacterium]|nr:hypothetical protein [Candidatus Peregrinibacteria bacterium]
MIPKDFSRLLSQNNLSAKERAQLIALNDIEEQKTGKKILSEKEENSITKEWKGHSSYEQQKFNSYMEIWYKVQILIIDAQTAWLIADSTLEQLLLHSFRIGQYPLIRRIQRIVDLFEGTVAFVTPKEAEEIMKKQRQAKVESGESLEYVIYQMVLASLPKEDQTMLKEYYEDIETEMDWLSEEEELAELIQKKDIDTIAERISLYDTLSWGYYACISIEEVLKRIASKKKISMYSAEAVQEYAESHKTTVRKLLKEEALSWIEEGMLEHDFSPLCTENPKLFQRWKEAKGKAERKVQELISKGLLKTFTKDETKGYLPHTVQKERAKKEAVYIDIQTLLDLPKEYQCSFIREIREYIEGDYDPNLGILFDEKDTKRKNHLDKNLLITSPFWTSLLNLQLDIIREMDKLFTCLKKKKNQPDILEIEEGTRAWIQEKQRCFFEYYERLLAFEELLQKVSKFFKADATFKVRGWIEALRFRIEVYNSFLDNAFMEMGLKGKKVNKKFEESHKCVREMYIPIEKADPKNQKEFMKDIEKKFSDILEN